MRVTSTRPGRLDVLRTFRVPTHATGHDPAQNASAANVLLGGDWTTIVQPISQRLTTWYACDIHVLRVEQFVLRLGRRRLCEEVFEQ